MHLKVTRIARAFVLLVIVSVLVGLYFGYVIIIFTFISWYVAESGEVPYKGTAYGMVLSLAPIVILVALYILHQHRHEPRIQDEELARLNKMARIQIDSLQKNWRRVYKEDAFGDRRTTLSISGRLNDKGSLKWGVYCEIKLTDSSHYIATGLLIIEQHTFFISPNSEAIMHDVDYEAIDMEGVNRGTFSSEQCRVTTDRSIMDVEKLLTHEASVIDLTLLLDTLGRLHEFSERPASAE